MAGTDSVTVVGGLRIPDALSVRGGVVTGDVNFSGNVAFSGNNTYSGTQAVSGLPVGANTSTVINDVTLAATDCGTIQNVTVDAKIVTLPATVVGLVFTIRNGGADGAVAVNVSPNASDKISGLGFTATDDKDAINTKATAKKGDYIKLVADGNIGWYVVDCVGVWARE